MSKAYPVYYGDNGVHEFWQDTAGNHCLIRNHGEKWWLAVMLDGKPSPADTARMKRVKPGAFSTFYALSAKTISELVKRTQKQYDITLRLDRTHEWRGKRNKGNMVLLKVAP